MPAPSEITGTVQGLGLLFRHLCDQKNGEPSIQSRGFLVQGDSEGGYGNESSTALL